MGAFVGSDGLGDPSYGEARGRRGLGLGGTGEGQGRKEMWYLNIINNMAAIAAGDNNSLDAGMMKEEFARRRVCLHRRAGGGRMPALPVSHPGVTLMNRLFACLVACVLFGSSAATAEDDGFVSLFNGKDLTGWRGNTEYWSVQDGAITATTTEDNLLTYNTFLIWEDGELGDFQLRLKFKIVGGNSGVQYRSRVIDEEKFVVGGYQADIDSTPRYTGINYEERTRGILAERGETVTITGEKTKDIIRFADAAALQELAVKPEQWNDYLIIARGRHLQHFINGVLMSETIDDSDGFTASGILALQAHAGPPMQVQFKEIALKAME